MFFRPRLHGCQREVVVAGDPRPADRVTVHVTGNASRRVHIFGIGTTLVVRTVEDGRLRFIIAKAHMHQVHWRCGGFFRA